jgi:predicted DNA-binding protein (UPF0251 family)
MLGQLAAPEAEPAISEAVDGLTLEKLVDQLPAAEATALRLTVLEGLSLRQAAMRLEISCRSVQRGQTEAGPRCLASAAGRWGLRPPFGMHLSGWSDRACSLKRGTYNVQQELISARQPQPQPSRPNLP